jgi:Xaa-Pro aminopeptidase
MLSMEPSIKRGLTFWDRALMPRDEFFERIVLVRREMRRMELGALIVSGNMYEDADLLYLTGGNVDGTLVLTADDDPVIFTVSGSRESFFLRDLTWINDVSYQGALIGPAVRNALHARNVTSGRIGTVGLQVLAGFPYQDLMQGLAGYDVQDFTANMQALRRRLRPREVMASQIALGITEKAACAADQAFAAGASNAAAAVEAERVARLEGAWDVRVLGNFYTDDLRPYERWSEDRRGQLLLWVATRYQGYWADRVVASAGGPDSEATRAVAAMTSAARAGVAASSVAEAGLSQLSAESRRSTLAYGLGQEIGIALNGTLEVSLRTEDLLTDGTLLSLRVFACGGKQPSFATALVQIGRAGAAPVVPAAR